MKKTDKDLHFKLMSLEYKIRDFFNPPVNILEGVGIKPGQYVLDFGCGPGSYSISASRLIGNNGKVYALDINPTAIDSLKKISSKKGLSNIETILSGCKTNLSDNSIDAVILFDVYHELDDKVKVLEELYRVLKPDGILSVSDHHLTRENLISSLKGSGLFKLSKEKNKIFIFNKIIY